MGRWWLAVCVVGLSCGTPADTDSDTESDTDTDTDVDCDPAAADDVDDDGYTEATGDCDDCDPTRSPSATEIAGNDVDEDCNGAADTVVGPCDADLAVDADATAAARALGLCATEATDGWGLVSAAWETPDGLALTTATDDTDGHGVLAQFGVANVPREGERLVVLSTGTARGVADPGYGTTGGTTHGYSTGFPPGFPTESSRCPNTITGSPYDGVALRLDLVPPLGARSVRLDVAWFTKSFPDFVCSTYGDGGAVLMAPAPAGALPSGNIVFDAANDSFAPEWTFLRACEAASPGGLEFTCPLGLGPLTGTGYSPEDQGENEGGHGFGAGTGWLTVAAPIDPPGTPLTLRIPIWDAGDGVLDAAIALDHLRFGTETVVTHTEAIP
jgi:hypothetical protein